MVLPAEISQVFFRCFDGAFHAGVAKPIFPGKGVVIKAGYQNYLARQGEKSLYLPRWWTLPSARDALYGTPLTIDLPEHYYARESRLDRKEQIPPKRRKT